MNDKTKTQLEKTIVFLACAAENATKAIDALQFTQAALNTANALVVLDNNKKG